MKKISEVCTKHIPSHSGTISSIQIIKKTKQKLSVSLLAGLFMSKFSSPELWKKTGRHLVKEQCTASTHTTRPPCYLPSSFPSTHTNGLFSEHNRFLIPIHFTSTTSIVMGRIHPGPVLMGVHRSSTSSGDLEGFRPWLMFCAQITDGNTFRGPAPPCPAHSVGQP